MVRNFGFGNKRLRLIAAFLGGALCLQAQMQAPVVSRQGGAVKRTIEGKVLGPSGSPLPGAAVLLKNTSTLQIRSYLAQNDGTYRFYGLSSDINYELRAEANGLTSKTKTVSVFDSHPVIHVNLKLYKKIKF